MYSKLCLEWSPIYCNFIVEDRLIYRSDIWNKKDYLREAFI